MLISVARSTTGVIVRVKVLDSTLSTGAGKTGLTFSSSGLIISTIADNEATATAYTQAGSTIETITTLGTFAAPTATKCRFKEVDATNHKGVYEIQIADARWAVSSSRSLLISLSGVTGIAETDAVIALDLPVDVAKVSNLARAAVKLSASADAITQGVVGAASSTTSVITSSLTPAAAVTDQFKGQILQFSEATTTANLRGQKTDITASTAGGVLTVTALSTAPVSGDVFTIG